MNGRWASEGPGAEERGEGNDVRARGIEWNRKVKEKRK